MESDMKFIEEDKLTEDMVDKIIGQLDDVEALSDDKYALRELLTGDKDNIKFKTDLYIEQIRALVQLLTADRIMRAQALAYNKPEEAKKMLESVPDSMSTLLMSLLVSKKRQGRGEFLSAYRGMKETDTGGGFMNQWLSK